MAILALHKGLNTRNRGHKCHNFSRGLNKHPNHTFSLSITSVKIEKNIF